MSKVRCRHCNGSFETSSALSHGGKVVCPLCGHVNVAPPAPPPLKKTVAKPKPSGVTVASGTSVAPSGGGNGSLTVLIVGVCALAASYFIFARELDGPSFLAYFLVASGVAYVVTLPTDTFVQLAALMALESIALVRIVEGVSRGMHRWNGLFFLMFLDFMIFMAGKSGSGDGSGGSFWSLGGCGSGCGSSCGGGCGGGCGGCGS